MYVGKRIKSILSILLICGLLLVCVPCRAYAVGPVALAPALKYAIAAGIVAGGLYATDNDALTYAINDYWDKASDHVKHQWNNAVTYGTGIGVILLNDTLRDSLKTYLEANYNPGENQKAEYSIDNPADIGIPYDYYGGYSKYILGRHPVSENWQWAVTGDLVMFSHRNIDYIKESMARSYFILQERGSVLWLVCMVYAPVSEIFVPNDISTVDIGLVGEGGTITGTFDFEGDISGFGGARPGEDVKVPCPPVPAAEWPDQWLDNLQDEMNRTGNPTLDDETSIEEWEDEYEWYLDEFGNIYKVKKGQAPRKPEDEPYRIPGPPFPAPDVPKNYPTEDDPDLTIEHHPPQTTITENPDGSRTETTTQTTTTTKKWWDPSSQRWRTTTSDTTTTTTVEFAPDGTETGRTTTTTTQPKGEREETAQPDDTAIDWEPLRRGLYELTEKFPFCLPWDLMRGIQSLEASQWDRKIRIEVGDGIWPAMVIDLTMFDGIASITRVILLIVFDLGLIFGTRKLMGGDV